MSGSKRFSIHNMNIKEYIKMPNVAVLTNDLQYEFTYKITHSEEELVQKLTAFNDFLEGVRKQNQTVIHQS